MKLFFRNATADHYRSTNGQIKCSPGTSHSPHWSARGRVSTLLCQLASVRLTTRFRRRVTFDYYFVSVIKRSQSSPALRCVTGIIVHLMLKLLLFQSAGRFCCLAHSFSDSLCPFGCTAFWPTLVYTTCSLQPSRKKSCICKVDLRPKS